MIWAIGGGSGAGKTTLANMLLRRLGDQGTHLTIDWYYHDLSHLKQAEREAVNFDHPGALDSALFVADLMTLAAGVPVEAPIYDFVSHTRLADSSRHVEPSRVIVTEGIHLLGIDEVVLRADEAVFIDISSGTRLERRLARDLAQRGRTAESVRVQWKATVAPMHDRFVQPTISSATVVVTEANELDHVADSLIAALEKSA